MRLRRNRKCNREGDGPTVRIVRIDFSFVEQLAGLEIVLGAPPQKMAASRYRDVLRIALGSIRGCAEGAFA